MPRAVPGQLSAGALCRAGWGWVGARGGGKSPGRRGTGGGPGTRGQRWELLGAPQARHSPVERGVSRGSSPVPAALSRSGSLLASLNSPLLEPRRLGGWRRTRRAHSQQEAETPPQAGSPGPTSWSWRLRAGRGSREEQVWRQVGKSLHRGLSVESVRLRLSPQGPGHPFHLEDSLQAAGGRQLCRHRCPRGWLPWRKPGRRGQAGAGEGLSQAPGGF